MLKKQIQGSFGLGGITGYMVDMLNCGCFKELLDVQCFDLNAVESIRENPNHKEISAIESKTDAFTAGHASSSVSIALGMARARTLQGQDYDVVAVLGDGAMTGGLAYEGLNNAGRLRRNNSVMHQMPARPTTV